MEQSTFAQKLKSVAKGALTIGVAVAAVAAPIVALNVVASWLSRKE